MKTIQLNLYGLEELDEKARQKALQEFQDLNIDYDWWDFAYNDFISICSYIGITVDKNSIHFEGFYSQGDGCSFDSDVDLSKLWAGMGTSNWQEYAPNVDFPFTLTTTDSRVMNLINRNKVDMNARIIARQRCYGVVVDLGVYPVSESVKNHDMIYGELDGLEKWFDGIAQILNRYLYKSLQQEYEYQTSNEAIAETIEANDYLFTADGKSATRLTRLANTQN